MYQAYWTIQILKYEIIGGTFLESIKFRIPPITQHELFKKIRIFWIRIKPYNNKTSHNKNPQKARLKNPKKITLLIGHIIKANSIK
jgi:hypothetical protein